jgi:hypothetical protein
MLRQAPKESRRNERGAKDGNVTFKSCLISRACALGVLSVLPLGFAAGAIAAPRVRCALQPADDALTGVTAFPVLEG